MGPGPAGQRAAGRSSGYRDADAYAYIHALVYTNSYLYLHSNINVYTDTDAYAYSNGYAHTDPYIYTHAHRHVYSDRHTDRNCHRHGHADVYTHTYSYANANLYTHGDTSAPATCSARPARTGRWIGFPGMER